MTWAYTKAGEPIRRPSAEDGVHADGPLTVEDMKGLIAGLIEAIIEEAKKEVAK